MVDGEKNMTEIDLAAIKARAEAATPGPWVARVFGLDPESLAAKAQSVLRDLITKPRNRNGDPQTPCSVYGPPMCHGQFTIADGSFIANARADVADLVAEVERLRKVVDAAMATMAAEDAFERAADTSDAEYLHSRFLQAIEDERAAVKSYKGIA